MADPMPLPKPIMGRIKAGSSNPTRDGFQNVAARLGVGTDNVSSYADYTLSSGNILSRLPRTLEAMYRSSWIIGIAVDSVAEDMCSAGVDMGSAIDPKISQEITADMQRLATWVKLSETKKWSRLYGGAIGVLLIDGQDMSTPLDVTTVRKGQFKGILPLDRWSLNSNFTDKVTELGPDLGKPTFYQVGINAPALIGQKIHYTRVIRMEGFLLPWFQRQVEQGWGMSIVERIYDRLIAFDSATLGVGQLTYKAHLRSIKIDGLRAILAAGGAMEDALIKQMDYIRKFQTSEGLTLLDAKDDMSHFTNTFAGLNDILMQFGEQISGAIQVPMVRLFGQSPGGLNSDGESALTTYQDGIFRHQEAEFRTPVGTVLTLHHINVTGKLPPKGWNFKFNHLSQMSEKEKAETAVQVATGVAIVYDSGIITQKVALQELKQSADDTGIFTNITEADINAANDDPPPPPGEGDANVGAEGEDGPGDPEGKVKPPSPKPKQAHLDA